jgi:hypothetical protein
MSDDKIVVLNSSAALIEEAKKERQRLLAQIEQSQRTIEHSRQIIARSPVCFRAHHIYRPARRFD